jgi:putative oxidoreductase
MPRSSAGKRTETIFLWLASAVLALGIGLAGLTKFLQPHRWQDLFVSWGYPAWFASVVGIAEVMGAIGLLVPRVAFYAATLLAGIMTAAFLTLLSHPGGPLGRGATPAFYLVLLAAVVALRRKRKEVIAYDLS